VCGNSLLLPIVATDRALLEALEEELLHPLVIARTIEKVVAELQQPEGGPAARVKFLQKEQAGLQAQVERLAQAIALGGPLEALVAEMKRLEACRTAVAAELEAVGRTMRAKIRTRDVVALVEAAVADYRGLLSRQTTEARGLLRELLVDRVVYTPGSDGTCEFTAQCSLGKILRGAVDPSGGDPGGIRSLMEPGGVRRA
jgi:site-specific DNA recombinase